MHTIFTLWSAFLAWLTAVEADAPAALPFDPDLPPYHPLCD